MIYIFFAKMTQPQPSREQIEAAGFYQERAPLQQTSTRYAAARCLYAGRTDSAYTVIIENPDYGRMLFLDGELQSTSYDEHIYHETLVHPIMRALNHIDDKRVLIVGGAEGATVREVLKWGPNKVRSIDWVDIDGALVNVCRSVLGYVDNEMYSNRQVNYHCADIMDYLPNEALYDCIIIDLPDPDPHGEVLYREQFWRKIRRALKARGAVVSHVGPVEPGVLRQEGLNIVRSGASGRFDRGYAYHTLMPSYQGEWGFWMSCAPTMAGEFPENCRVMTNHYLGTIFHWDRHWMVAN
jgi:spermidine synthase